MASGGRNQKSLCNCTALRKATRRVSQLYDSALEPCGLRATQRTILSQIARTGTPPMGELAEALVMDRGALTHNLKPLQRDGLIKISVDPQDRRNRHLSRAAVRKAMRFPPVHGGLVDTETPGKGRLALAKALARRFDLFACDHGRNVCISHRSSQCLLHREMMH